jgi:hypothetical protein
VLAPATKSAELTGSRTVNELNPGSLAAVGERGPSVAVKMTLAGASVGARLWSRLYHLLDGEGRTLSQPHPAILLRWQPG